MNNAEKLSYALGMNLGENLKSQGITVDNSAAFIRAMEAVMKGGELELSAEESNAVINEYMTAKAESASRENIEKGKTFLAENKGKEGVIELPSGLQYQVITAGTGKKPGKTDQVTTHYHGMLIDGTVFDSSVERGQPATFGVNQVIAGWTEALQLMPEGSKWRLFIPSNMAYGERGAGQHIGPHATLVFDVELIKVN